MGKRRREKRDKKKKIKMRQNKKLWVGKPFSAEKRATRLSAILQGVAMFLCRGERAASEGEGARSEEEVILRARFSAAVCQSACERSISRMGQNQMLGSFWLPRKRKMKSSHRCHPDPRAVKAVKASMCSLRKFSKPHDFNLKESIAIVSTSK